jgi:ATP-dependent DNA ligase
VSPAVPLIEHVLGVPKWSFEAKLDGYRAIKSGGLELRSAVVS